VTEIFEARKPKDPAVIAEIDGGRNLSARNAAASERSSSAAKAVSNANTSFRTASTFLVHSGDFVKAGQALVDGPLVPHDILRVSGEEAVQQYLSTRSKRLSQPARGNQRQAHRDHRRPHAAQGARRERRRHRTCCRVW
jgi:DNA-directed RNA polymerase subunit beta'